MKIKYALLDKLNTLTNREIDFILYVARFQDECGYVKGLYYRNVCDNAKMCKQTFYDTLRSLKQKGIITYNRVDSDYDITILNNDFSYPSAYSEGYINVSRKVFHTEKFRKLKAKEKILLLHFMKITHSSNSSYQIGTDKLYKKYMDMLGVTKRVLRGYLHTLRKYFSIGIKDGKYFINYLASVFNNRVEVSETDQYFDHLVLVSCRRSRIKRVAEQEVKEIITVIKQYRQDAMNSGKKIVDLVDTCIQGSVEGTKEKVLNSRYVHKLVRTALLSI